MGANKLIERTIPFPARRTDPHQSEDISSEPGKVTQKWSRSPVQRNLGASSKTKAKKSTYAEEKNTELAREVDFLERKMIQIRGF